MGKNIQEDIKRLNKITHLCISIEAVIGNMNNEKEYNRMRDYIQSKFDYNLPYNHVFFKKEVVVK